MNRLLDRFRLDHVWLAASETRLCALLKPFLAFREHSFYFPDAPLRKAKLLAAERRVLAPVLWNGHEAGALRLESVQPVEVRSILPLLPDIINLCLQNLALAEAVKLDGATGLLSEDALLEELARAIEFQPDADKGTAKKRINCLGLIVLDWPHAEMVGQRAGYKARNELWRQMADELRDTLPQEAVAANIGSNEWLHEFAILLPAFGRSACHALAKEIIAKLTKIEAVDPFSSGAIPVFLQAGHILFPQDLQGSDLRLPAREQALVLRDRARLAARAASYAGCKRPVMAFAWLLKRGGVILDCPTHNRVRISLGRASYARPGMRFYVLAPGEKNRVSKAEIIIRSVGDKDSIAEIFHQENPPLPGDCLILFHSRGNEDATALLEHVNFFERFNDTSRDMPEYALSITRFHNIPAGENCRTLAEKFYENLAAWQTGEKPEDAREIIGGYYGADGIAVFWPGASASEVVQCLKSAHDKLGDCEAASGVFAYPCLNFSRSDSEACCLKALEYASLLPPPRIGVLDYLALTISGDKRFSQGDELGAIDDYRLALLLKPDDALALNSLAVCMAAINKPAESIGLLEKALSTQPDNSLRAKICYNLANIHQKEKDFEKARKYYQMCIKADAGHAYAWIRLGQIHAKNGKPRLAHAVLLHAERIAGDNPDILNITRRQLARLAAAENKTDSARDILHDALLLNPADTDSLLFLAKTYLLDDPATAETLARKCLRLGADAFDILAKALENQGRLEESRMIRKHV